MKGLRNLINVISDVCVCVCTTLVGGLLEIKQNYLKDNFFQYLHGDIFHSFVRGGC
jgi:hypothetical protein